MNATDALTIQLTALVAVHGLDRVQKALARVDDGCVARLDQLESNKVPHQRPAARAKMARRKKGVEELVQAAGIDPSADSLVCRIAHAYEQKAFLPDLWRVRRFLESEGIEASRLRSRSTALPKVIHVLARQPLHRLQEILAESKSSKGEFAILADHILGRPSSEAVRPERGLKESSPGSAHNG